MYALSSQPPAPTRVASLSGRDGAAGASPAVIRRGVWRIGVGGFAGFVLGLDIVLACLIEQLLKATTADDLVVPGVLHSGWSPARGVFFYLGPGGLAIVGGCLLLGAACGWASATRALAARDSVTQGLAARDPAGRNSAELAETVQTSVAPAIMEPTATTEATTKRPSERGA